MGTTATASEANSAAWRISSGVIVRDIKIARISTAKMGNKEARVTTPKPEREDWPLPYTILHSEAKALHRIPFEKAGLIQVNLQGQPKDSSFSNSRLRLTLSKAFEESSRQQ